ncbi:MAG TPA: hypothetical protein VGC20_12035, partial [bacterium]
RIPGWPATSDRKRLSSHTNFPVTSSLLHLPCNDIKSRTKFERKALLRRRKVFSVMWIVL